MNSFDVFFDDLYNSCVELGFTSLSDGKIIDLGAPEIIEQKYKIVLPLALQSYMRNFGNKPWLNFVNYQFSVKSIDYCYTEFAECPEFYDEVRTKALSKYDLEGKVAFIDFEETNGAFTFVPLFEENPLVYTYFIGGVTYVSPVSFLDLTRDAVFWAVYYALKSEFSDRFSGQFFDFYRDILFVRKLNTNNLIRYRKSFYTSMEDELNRKTTIMGFNEFEQKFMSYILERIS